MPDQTCRFFTASDDEIRAGAVTDVYFLRTKQVLEARGLDKPVRVEVVAKGLPAGHEWAVLAGVEDALRLLKGCPVMVEGLPEGSVFKAYQPVLSLEGRYLDFGLYETALLGFLCQASGVATKAARCRRLIGTKPLIHFGARRMHPAIAPMLDRSAYIGGCDGVAVVLSAEKIGIAPSGTIPHALVLLVGDTLETARAFHAVIDPAVRRVALIDTFQDEKFEALRLAAGMGDALWALRLDTPSSRRGNFAKILQEVRWELDLRGFANLKLLVSGGLDEADIPPLVPWADAFGIGTAISNAPVIDLSLDIVEIEGEPIAKRGKESGGKQLFFCAACGVESVLPARTKNPRCRTCRA
ncbi:MAG: nicotinate phosphoribosyltransferase, partial [Elusimicrobia bacterium]|nr:nicotinate phosphoribosyltransferase [Elusimicrobiota bacterium]